MIATRKLAVLGATLLVALPACETLTVPDFNNPGIVELTDNPTRSAVVAAAQGVMIGARKGIGEFNRYVAVLGALGREAWHFDPSDPRLITELLVGPLDPGGASFGGGGHWADRYTNIRNANILLDAVDAAGDALSNAEKEGIRGFAKTMQALDFLLVINTRDTFGAPIDVGGDPTAAPAPIASKTEVFARIVQLLDEGQTHLNAAGATFPFRLSSGFTGFNTPATFLRFNRALRARVEAYRGNWSQVLTALGASFVNPATPNQNAAVTLADLERGVYHAYSSGPGDVTNGLFTKRNELVVHPSVAADAQPGDARLTRKTEQLAAPKSDPGGTFGISSDRIFRVYSSLSSPIPIIRNEELVLLRAEANIQVNTAASIAAALEDINLIRRVSGSLANIGTAAWTVTMAQSDRINELLYNRRYSLLWEGHRWIDARRYNQLAQLPKGHAQFVRFSQFPFPAPECVARTPRPAQGCAQVVGF